VRSTRPTRGRRSAEQKSECPILISAQTPGSDRSLLYRAGARGISWIHRGGMPGLLAPARPGETNAIATAPSARKSAKGREHLLVRREPAGRLLGIREPAVHGNLEHTTAGPMQLHLRAGCRLLNQTCRRTGARFIASHSAVFDLNLHRLLSGLSSRLLKQQQPRPSRRDPPPSP
jgi:hypothetical protein